MPSRSLCVLSSFMSYFVRCSLLSFVLYVFWPTIEHIFKRYLLLPCHFVPCVILYPISHAFSCAMLFTVYCFVMSFPMLCPIYSCPISCSCLSHKKYSYVCSSEMTSCVLCDCVLSLVLLCCILCPSISSCCLWLILFLDFPIYLKAMSLVLLCPVPCRQRYIVARL
jgi:hypothetical protein